MNTAREAMLKVARQSLAEAHERLAKLTTAHLLLAGAIQDNNTSLELIAKQLGTVCEDAQGLWTQAAWAKAAVLTLIGEAPDNVVPMKKVKP